MGPAPAKKVSHTTSNEFRRAAEKVVREFQERRPLRAGSLLISLFGDAIAPHGGAVWLGSLIKVLAPFGVNERLVRTSVFRLAKEDWLESDQIGRRSYYRLTNEGRLRFHDASRRIYSGPRRDWDGTWCLVLIGGVAAQNREVIRKELGWLGFAPFSSNVLAHPSPDMQIVEERIEILGDSDRIIIMRASTVEDRQRTSYLQQLVGESWSLQSLDNRYEEFLQRFRPVYRAVRRSRSPDPTAAFQLRTLLIHEYRKILLRDPFLPAALLPRRWNGVSAYQLCRNIYSLVAGPTEDFLTEALENADGPLPPAGPTFYKRFGGLRSDPDTTK